MEENNENSELKTKKDRRKAKKITNSILMFGGLLVSLVAVIAIPLALNTNKNIKRDTYLDDGSSGLRIETKSEIKETIPNKEYDFSFSQVQKDVKDAVFNKEFKELKTNDSFSQSLPIIKHETTPIFDKNDNLKNFHNEWKKDEQNNKARGIKEISKTGSTIVNEFDFRKFLKDYYTKTYNDKDPLTEDKLNNMITARELLNLARIENNFTYVIEREGQYFYKDLKAGIIAINIRDFIRNCVVKLIEFARSFIDRTKIKLKPEEFLAKILIKKATFTTKMEIDPVTHEVKSFTFSSKINMSFKQE